jgi:succinate dehydrogenase/fumarate reductase-like Fe-S protein
MAEKIVNVTISRLDTSSGQPPYDQTYCVPIVGEMAVLQVLDYIYDYLDCTISYHDHGACAQGICKQCTVLINGKPGLMCQTLVREDVRLEPLPKFKIVKDLVYERGGKAHHG